MKKLRSAVTSLVIVILLMICLLPSSAFADRAGQWYHAQDGRWAYQLTEGDWAYGWQKIDGVWYYFDSVGWMVTGWQAIDGVWYYFHNDGSMAADEWIGNDYVDQNGAWSDSSGGGTDNSIQEGWFNDSSGRWAYQFADGSWAYGWKTISGIRYYFDSVGWMVTDWQAIDGSWFYFDEDGAIVTNAIVDGYYVDANGAMVTNSWVQKDGAWYYFGSNGAMLTGWQMIESERYFFYDNGIMAMNTWVGDNYLGPTGALISKSEINQAEQQQAHDRMMALISQYPEGMPWTNDNSYVWNAGSADGLWTPGYYTGYGCQAFACILSDAAFGNADAKLVTNVVFEDLRVGDILRINGDSHTVIITEVDNDHIVVAEGNYHASIHWGSVFTREEVLAVTNWYFTRYQD